MKRWISIAIAGLVFGAAATHAAQVGLIKINGAIGPATANYISRAIDVAANQNDECLVIQLNTPGGLATSMDDIVQEFYASRVPVVVYVSPEGAMAGSAGVYITLAADIAVMAPHTTIGAAHPVEIGNEDETTNSIMMQKIGNAYTKVMQTIAEKRHRNVEWAKSSVTASEAITSEEALKKKVIDLIATNVPDLLQKLNDRSVNGKVLKTAGANVVEIPMSAGEKFFQLFWQPQVMMLLMLIAIYGIIAEMSHPGAIFPGVAGALALILLLYMSATLPLNVAGVVLILLALALFIIDIFAPTHGVLTVGGIIAFFLGALMLFNHAPKVYQLPMSWIISTTLVTAAFFVFFVSKGIRAQFSPKRAGAETMLGKTVAALSRIDSQNGKVFIEGEHWNAVSETPIETGQAVEIIGIAGLTLKVKPK
ncbi:MAG TPA: nodulation protein NfeD [Candidatus Dormibacteraeota bacterium]|jgi:membrane-bound serine protease (ClpP class)|nr:nodulation protein NfeD [Candidatus Dormibacteraeota bacterium]